MVDLGLFRSARLNAALVGMFAYAACAQAMMTLLPFYLQAGLKFTPIQSGLGMLPFALAMLIMPKVGGRLASVLQPSVIMSSGLALVGFGNVACAYAVSAGGYLPFALASTLLGAGAGLLNGDTQKNIMVCVPPDRLGMGSGLSTTMRFTAISLAIGLYGALLVFFTSHSLTTQLQTLAPDYIFIAPQLAQQVAVGDLSKLASGLPSTLELRLQSLAEQAFTSGFSQMLEIAALAAFLSSAIVAIYLRRPIPQHLPSTVI
ncbi:Major Facilitator Superfamily protein [compost metagenome]